MFHEFPDMRNAIDYTDPAHDRRTGRPLIEIDRAVDLGRLPPEPPVWLELAKATAAVLAVLCFLAGLYVWHLVGWI